MTICEICNQSFRKKHYFAKHMERHYEHLTIMRKYEKKSLNGIEYVNGVPKVVFVCWFGSLTKNSFFMPESRMNAFNSLVANINVPVILITNKNYRMFEKEDDPIHEMFDYMSGNHKSDYLRAYLLHHYGGGYHDIKYRSKGWETAWDDDEWTEDENIWIYGRQEPYESAIGYPPGSKHIQKEYNKLVTMGWVICKHNTEFTRDLLSALNKTLDKHKTNLMSYPAINPGGYYSDAPFSMAIPDSYPLRWLEMMGEHSHPLMLKYNEHIKFGISDADKKKKYK